MLVSPFRMATVAAIVALSTPLFAQPPAIPSTPTQAPAARRLSLDEAVRLALEQNLGIQIARVDPQIQDTAVAQAQASWQPRVLTTIARNAQDQPAESAIVPSSQNATFASAVGVNQTLPWGATYTAGWNNERQTTTNILSNFSPLLLSTTNFNYTQPLLRNFSIDQIRQQLAISRKVRDLSDINVKAVIAETTRAVENAYWDLVYADENLKVQRESLDLSEQSLRDSQQRAASGTMARIDVVQDQAEVANNQQSVIVAEGLVQTAEDRLRGLILDPSAADFWSTALEPADSAAFSDTPVDVDAAVARALKERTDVLQTRNGMQQDALTLRFDQNQLLPDVNVVLNYGTFGVGGTELTPVDLSVASSVAPSSRSIVSQRGYGSVLGDVLASAYPQWSIGVQIGYQLGNGAAKADLARTRLQATQNATRLKYVEMQVQLQVREAARQVDTNRKRVVAARSATELQREKLDAEQRKVAAGTSVAFFVIQAQRDLAQARTLETRVLLDYDRALVDFETVQEVPLPGVGIGSAGDALAAGSSPATVASGPSALGSRTDRR